MEKKEKYWRLAAFSRGVFWAGATGLILSFFGFPIVFFWAGAPADGAVSFIKQVFAWTFLLSGAVAYPIFFAHIVLAVFGYDLLKLSGRR